MKKYKWNILLMFLMGIGVISVFTKDESPVKIIQSIMHLNMKWCAIGLLCMMIYWGIETVIQHGLVRKSYSHQSIWNSFKVVMTGHFFNAVTPFASGGQPMQMIVMNKQGMSLGFSMSVLMIKFIVYQIILTVYSLVVLIMKIKFFYTNINGLVYLALIGFVVNLLVVLGLLGAAFMKETLKKAAFIIINALKKVGIIRHPLKWKHKIVKQVEVFNANFKALRSNGTLIFYIVLLTIIQLTAYFFIPYTVYRAFGLQHTKVFQMIAAAAFIVMIASFIPSPGSSGVAEGSFLLFFKLFFPQSILPAAVLVWRGLTFYLPLSLGAVVTLLPNIKEKTATKNLTSKHI